ncbi:MAG: hypothetical protein ACYS80_25210, partial [Planctomycetota bacterium]
IRSNQALQKYLSAYKASRDNLHTTHTFLHFLFDTDRLCLVHYMLIILDETSCLVISSRLGLAAANAAAILIPNDGGWRI